MPGSVGEIGMAYRRRVSRDFAIVGSTVLAACLFVALVTNIFVAIVLALLATAALYCPVFRLTDELLLTTDRPPEVVREAFAGEECPLVAIERSWADDVERVDEGWEFGYTAFAVFRRDIRYETTTTDGGVRVETSINDTDSTTYEIDVEAAEGGSRVSVTGRRPSRIHLRGVVFAATRRNYERRAYEALGYEVERIESDVGVLTPDSDR